MKYSELSQFTHAELKNFTHAQLALDKLELLSEANKNKVVPEETVSKLRLLCQEAIKSTGDPNLMLPTEKMTIEKVLKFISDIGNIAKFGNNTIKVAEIIKSVYEDIMDLINS